MNHKVVICPECAGDIKIGIAIRPHTEFRAGYLCPVQILNHENIELMDVYKCENCGYSYVENYKEYGP